MKINDPEKKKIPVKGIRVRSLNVAMIVLSCLLYAALLFITCQAAADYDRMVQTTSQYIAYQEDAAQVSAGSDYLTEQVRLFAVTLDSGYVENYFHETNVARRRETALEQLDKQASPRALRYLETALDYSNQLMEREVYAIRLAAESLSLDPAALDPKVAQVKLSKKDAALSAQAKLDEVRDLVFGTEYQAKKQLITSNIDYFLTDVMSSTQNAQQLSLKDLDNTLLMERALFSALLDRKSVV